MNELLPYEEQLAGKLANLPLPDEDKGWEAMRKMLDDDDDDDGIVPPVNRGCRTWGGLLLLIVLVAGIVILTWKKQTVNPTDAPRNPAILKDSSLAVTPAAADTTVLTGRPLSPGSPTNKLQQHSGHNKPADSTITPEEPYAGKPTRPGAVVSKLQPGQENKNAGITEKFTGNSAVTAYSHKSIAATIRKNQAQQENNARLEKSTAKKPAVSGAAPLTPAEALNRVTASTIKNQSPGSNADVLAGNDGNPATGKDTIPTSDTTNKTLATHTGSTPHSKDNNKKEQGDDNRDKIWFGAGLALQQLIPVNGQKAVPYSSSGRKGSLGDYIPSAYVRVYHKRKFLQVEFKYGAPQYTKDLAYQKTVISSDSSSGISVANVNRVKKTYYHQLPVSIHYTPVPNLSLGAGVVWNKFQSAVVEQQTRSFRGNVDIDSSGAAVPTKLLTLRGDSATSFSKSYLQCMVEAQYTWRRFSLGARYAFGLQPYLTFSSPATGQQQRERNASLNIFIRYELWRWKKK